jgi:hypothetical protein
MRTVQDPFTGEDVQISDRLVDRFRGKYACGPHLPNGNPEFGWRQFEAPPIQHEAAQYIARLEWLVRVILEEDLNADAADGVTVLDVWRKEASRVLEAQ